MDDLRVWTDGRDIVVARDMLHIPALLDRYYRVTGHTLRHTVWSEVPLSQNLRVQQGHCVRHVKGGDLLRDHESWVGRVAQDSRSVDESPGGW
jgi:hypothetical protein